MSEAILRPVFSENQILSAADVNGIVSHAGDARSRHNLYLHSWGIVHGLELQAEDREDGTGTYKEITVSAGMALDGNGREIVVTESIRLSEDLFDQLNVEESGDGLKYPVLIVGRDQEQAASAVSPSVCNPAQATRTIEGSDITFGRVGDAMELNSQTEETAAASGGWNILLGFVEWNGERFSAAHDEADGVARRYAGVRGEDVTAPNERLTLRSADRTVADKATLVVDNENGGEMRFGLQNEQGEVTAPVFTVNANGDITAKGKILGAIAGGVQVESGVVADGALVPLPAGITQEQVDSGEASIQVQLSARFQRPAAFPNPNVFPALPSPPAAPDAFWFMQALECYAEDRRVRCLVQWVTSDGSQGPLILPGVCDYHVFGFVKEEEGA